MIPTKRDSTRPSSPGRAAPSARTVVRAVRGTGPGLHPAILLPAILLLPAIALGLLAGCGSGGGGEPSDQPRARVSVSVERGDPPLTVVYDGTESEDPAGGGLAFAWDLGGGVQASGTTGAVVYQEPGSHHLQLTVTDVHGARSTDERVVVVDGNLPTETPADRVLHLTNLRRREQGLAPLRGQNQLAAAALGHAVDMARLGYFSHESLDGRTPWDRIRDTGYSFTRAAENIAAGYEGAGSVVDAWMLSPGHRANILDEDLVELGVAYHAEAGSQYTTYWVQDFGERSGVFPVVIEDEAFATTDREIDVFIYGSGWAREMMVSENPDFAGATWEGFRQEITWTLSPGTGQRRLHVRLRREKAIREAHDEILLR